MKKTKIEWCDCTVNPVIGCTFGCEYCYAKKLNGRFHWVKDFRKPQFRPEQLQKLYTPRPQTIFMNSMSDIADWRQEWRDIVFKVMEDNPQHKYLFLSKRPETIKYIAGAWIGCSITRECEIDRVNRLLFLHTNRFVSIEPILEDLHPENHDLLFKQVHWVIVGAETGNRKGKVTPKAEWINKIIEHCKADNVPIFMKDSLLNIVGAANMIREIPRGLTE